VCGVWVDDRRRLGEGGRGSGGRDGQRMKGPMTCKVTCCQPGVAVTFGAHKVNVPGCRSRHKTPQDPRDKKRVWKKGLTN
jgi:hypothetical protein